MNTRINSATGKPQTAIRLSFLAAVTIFCATASFAQSFNCAKASNAVEEAICADQELKNLDSKMASLYNQALAKASAKDKRSLRSEQVGWIKGRNDCPKQTNFKACIGEFYSQRISRLEPLAGGGGGSAPDESTVTSRANYSCPSGPDLVVTFAGPEKVSIVVGVDTLNLSRVQSGSGAKYSGNGATFWTQGNGAQFDYKGKSYKCQEKK